MKLFKKSAQVEFLEARVLMAAPMSGLYQTAPKVRATTTAVISASIIARIWDTKIRLTLHPTTLALSLFYEVYVVIRIQASKTHQTP